MVSINSGIGAPSPYVIGRHLDVVFVDSGVGARLLNILGRHFYFGVSGGVYAPDRSEGLRATKMVGCGHVHRLLTHNVVFASPPSEEGVVPSLKVVPALRDEAGIVLAAGSVFALGDETGVVLALHVALLVLLLLRGIPVE
jgi:hypothetical protein